MNGTATTSPPVAPKPVVRFLTSEFDAYAEALGHDSNVKKARFTGLGIATISRLRSGKQNPGPLVIAAIYQTCGDAAGRFFDFRGSDR
jgi:hypothetical protein